MERLTFNAMNTLIEVLVDTTETQWKEEIQKWFLTFEQKYSRFIDHNELANFNDSNEWVIVEDELFEIIKTAFHYAVFTDFYFNPLIGARLKQLGYDRSFEFISEEKEYEYQSFNYIQQNSLKFYPSLRAIEKKSKEKIDLGGFGKGWSVNQAGKQMKNKQINAGVINAGGDLVVWGEMEQKLGIVNPFNEKEDIAQFVFNSGAVATSNKIFRKWKQGNVKRHHLLNGKTGLPSESDVIQATVFASNVAEAEVISKVLCILSFKEGIHWLLEKFPNAACVLIHEDGKIAISHTIKRHVKKLMLA